MSTPIETRESRHKHLPDRLAESVEATGARTWEWPLPRPSWSDDVAQSYAAYQRDVSSRAAREVDVATILRYFDVLELQARLFEEMIGLETFVDVNSAGTAVADPRLNAFARMVSVGIKLANEIGATPMSRVKLGLYAVEGQTATFALEREINRFSDEQVEVRVEDGHVVMSW